MTRTRRADLADLVWAAVLVLAVLGPVLVRRGVVLRGDMVFVPRQPWKAEWLGLDGAAGRFVPGDAVVSLLTHVVPGDVVQKLVLGGAVLVGAVGASRLVGSSAFVARAAAATVYVWNPWVHERLGIGQWGMVVGYFLLPALVLAARAFAAHPRRGWPGLVVALGLSAWCSPPAGLVAVLAATAVVAWCARRATPVLLTLAVAVVVNAPWVVPSLLGPGVDPAAGQFDGFAAEPESRAGVLLSVVSLGGIWKTSVVPSERTVVLVLALAAALTAVCLVGLRWTPAPARDLRAPLALLAVGAVLVTLLPTVGPVADLLERTAGAVPAVGLVRDSHRFLGMTALLLAVGVAGAADRLARAAGHGREALGLVAGLLVVWPVACLPSLAWGMGGELRPVTFPEEWHVVQGEMRDEVTVVLPWRGGYRGLAFNDRRSTLDPAPRFFDPPVLIDDRLYLADRTLDSEDERLRAVARALESSDPAAALTDLGVGQVLLEKGSGATETDLPEGEVLHDGPELALVDLAGPPQRGSLDRVPLAPVVVADVAALLVVLAGMCASAGRRVYVVRNVIDTGEVFR